MSEQMVAPSSNGGTEVGSEWLTIRDVARFVRKSPSSVHKLWPEWVAQYGLRPVRYGGRKRGRLLFARADVEVMLERWRCQ